MWFDKIAGLNKNLKRDKMEIKYFLLISIK